VAILVGAGLTSHGANQMTVNLSQRSGGLKKAGLGSLFGVVTNNSGPWTYYLTNAFLFVSEHQTRIGEGTRIPPGTSAVASVIRGTPIHMMCRFGDLCYGWAPYSWPGLTSSWRAPEAAYSWLEQVTNAVNDIKSNYQDIVYAVAIFKEPEGQLWDTNFFNDPNIPGTAQAQRVNYVWTQTFRAIRALSPTLKIMGPNYEDYRPQFFASHQTLMRDFLTNAIATGTVPNIVGWHNLNANPIAPGDIGTALKNYYRPLEMSLGVPGAPLPVAIEEFGANNGAFEGTPGQMVPYWAEFERDGIEFANMGIYENGGDLGNTMRYTMWDTSPEPNAGWFMMNWHLQMQGQYVPVTAQGIDGVASWNSTNRTLTILFGGADGDATIQVNGLGALGLGSTVRVRLDMARWTTNSNVANSKVACGGDPQTGPYNLYDRNLALDASGNLAVPVNAVDGIYNGYRVLITSSNSPDIYPTKYEAENATYNHVAVHGGGASPQASAGTYVGGIDYGDSYVCFHVPAPSNGFYTMIIRYAANSAYGPASHYITVNGQLQGVVNYPPTVGWANSELRTTACLVSLASGMNDILLTRATNYAELDFIDVRPNIHRYDAELATNNNVSLRTFNTCYIPNGVGAIDNADSYVNFSVVAPVAGTYLLSVAYANGTSSTATHLVAVNAASVGSVVYPPTGGWLGGGWLSGSNPSLVIRTSTLPVALNAGLNSLRLTHSANYAELDYITLTPTSNLTPSVPRLGITITNGTNLALSWPTPAAGYYLQQTAVLPATSWSKTTNPANVVGDRIQVSVPVTSSNTFFRLCP
jgi:hypothetical protein